MSLPKQGIEIRSAVLNITPHLSVQGGSLSAISPSEQSGFTVSAMWYDLLAENCFADAVFTAAPTADGTYRLTLNTQSSGAGRLWTALGGTSWHSLTNFYSLGYGPTDESYSDVTLAQQASDQGIDEVALDFLLAESTPLLQLVAQFNQHGFYTHIQPTYRNWRHVVDGASFAGYMAQRPSQLRNTIRRSSKKLYRDHDAAVEIYQVFESEAQVTTALGAYNDVYARSWKARELHPTFIPNLVRRYAAQGKIRLGILRVEGAPVAAQIWIVDNSCAYIYKLAHDPQYASYSVGTLLTAELMAAVIEHDRVAVVDFGIGNEAYKQHWMTSSRQFASLRAINRTTVAGRALLAAVNTKALFKTLRPSEQ